MTDNLPVGGLPRSPEPDPAHQPATDTEDDELAQPTIAASEAIAAVFPDLDPTVVAHVLGLNLDPRSQNERRNR